jgi:hypothetical protein
MDKIEGFLEVGRSETHDVVVNLDAKTVAGFDATGGHIVFSPRQARTFANLLIKHAQYAESEAKGKHPNEGITGG